MTIRLNQVYQSRRSSLKLEVCGKKGGKFKTRVLTEKYGVYAGTHTVSPILLQKEYTLLDKKAYELYG